MCYKVRAQLGGRIFHGPGPIFVVNEFGPGTFLVTGPRELCTPSHLLCTTPGCPEE
jgi:hypothetical protein